MEEEKISEQNIVDALLEAADLRKGVENRRKIVIQRGKKRLFEFTIEPIDENIYSKCNRQNLKNRGRRSEELDSARFLSQIIYEATISEDKKRVWNNKAVWEKLGAITGTDVVNAVLTPGEKARVFEIVEEISGFNIANLDEEIENF